MLEQARMLRNKRKHMKFAMALPITLAALTQAMPSYASEKEALEGEIIVTATRKAEALSRVPVAIVAKDQLELDKQGVRSIADIAQITPGVSFGQSAMLYGTGQTAIAIRGIASASGIPTTGVYIDDTPVQTRIGVSPSLSNPYPQVFDLDRVEVLKGPQGTLFGSGSVGGAIRFIMPQPVYEGSSLYARGELATTKNGAGTYEAGLAGGTALVEDKVGLRASVWYRKDGGYVDRLDPYTKELVEEDINGESAFSARLALGVKPSETLTITPTIFFQGRNIADGSRFELAESDLSKGDLRISLVKLAEKHRDRFYLPSNKIELELGGVTLTSDTSYLHRKTNTIGDDFSLNFAFFADYAGGDFPEGFEDNKPFTISNTKQTAFTQEFRLQNSDPDSRLNWIVGAFYQNSYVRDQYASSDEDILDVINFGRAEKGEEPYDNLTEGFGTELYQGQYTLLQRNEHRDKQYAVYGQADYEIVPRVKMLVGLRYTIADYEFEGFTAGPVYATDGQTDKAKTKTKTFTPKFGLSFQADQNNLFYANVAKGVRGPGISPPVGSNCADDAAAIGFDELATLQVKPDSIWSYELGSKNRLFDGKLMVDASAYRVKWKQVQTQFTLPQCLIYTALNLGNAQIDGFDLSLAARPVDGLSLGATVSRINARYTTAVPGPDESITRKAGEPLAGVAPWTVQLNGEYSHSLSNGEIYGRADFSYSSHDSRPLDVDSPLVDPELPRAPATSILDLRVGTRLEVADNKDLDVSLFVNNVTNSQPLVSLYHEFPGSTWFRSGTFRPRTVGVTASIRY